MTEYKTAYRLDNGQEVHEGDIIIDFRGDKWEFIMVTGDQKIYAKRLNKNHHQMFFPSIFGLSLISPQIQRDGKSAASGGD